MDDHRERDEGHHVGLARDLHVLTRRFANRREVLRWLGGATLLPATACLEAVVGAGGSGGAATEGGSCAELPEETAGPYPGDGSNGKNVLGVEGVVRSDIRASIGSATGVAAGVPLTVTLRLLSIDGCAGIAGRAIYLWHCDRDGNYSMYSQAIANENYLRGVQETDAEGSVTFQTVFPGCYDGRWPHIHFEIYPGLDQAGSSDDKLATSQLALPKAACSEVYATSGYTASALNLSGQSLDDDNVFGDDGAERQLAKVSGDAEAGYVATLTIAI